jgi:hypothetical protein
MMGNALRMQLIRKRRKSEIGKLILSRKIELARFANNSIPAVLPETDSPYFLAVTLSSLSQIVATPAFGHISVRPD